MWKQQQVLHGEAVQADIHPETVHCEFPIEHPSGQLLVNMTSDRLWIDRNVSSLKR